MTSLNAREIRAIAARAGALLRRVEAAAGEDELDAIAREIVTLELRLSGDPRIASAWISGSG